MNSVYLGSTVNNDGDSEIDIQHCILKPQEPTFATVRNTWRSTKIRIFNSNVSMYLIGVFLYGAES